ncbi:MAG TPA: class I SAM-dependent methyltransferase [Solirubrobacteraceae bacterium]|nr:class I SAM-dependent methyltransferase [Solirubrobacteraceae bacterium]
MTSSQDSGARISPTAHYTGYVWARNGLSHPELATREGRLLFDSLQPAMVGSRAIGGATLESYLLARHRAIDALLERAIGAGEISQVIEVAAGLSPRGWRLRRRYGDRLVYIETDLPGMAERKRAALERIGSLSERHRVRILDAVRDDDGPGSLAAVAGDLDRREGLAIVTEGLLGYLPTEAVDAIWRRFADTLAGFSRGRYVSDLHLAGAATPQVRAFRVALSAFVRGRVYLHFDDAGEGEAALHAAGFATAQIRPAVDVIGRRDGRGSRLANILEASTT